MHSDLMKRLKEQKDNPLPTPPVGYQVHWLDRNDQNLRYAATITRIQGPGKLELVIFKPRSMPVHKQGVLHVSHEVHQQKNNNVTISNGSWDYIPGQKMVAAHKEVHLAELERREAAMIEEERTRREADKQRKQIDREIEEEMAVAQAATKK